MDYTNSSLVDYVAISPNRTQNRKNSITRITPHCVVGQCSVEALGNVFAPTSRKASSNYGIGVDGRVGMYCEEKDRSWCSSSADNDNRAVTIECASDTTAPYAFRDVVYNNLIELCADICRRNGKTKLLWLNDKNTALAYEPKADEMILTAHRWFAATACPGDWMYSREADLAEKVTARLGGAAEEKSETTTAPTNEIYRVRKSWSDAESQLGAFRVLVYAKALADKNPGTSVFNSTGVAVYPEPDADSIADTLRDFICKCQKAFGVTADGIAGPKTLAAAPVLSAKVNCHHAAVQPVQERLSELGYSEVGTADGWTGPKFTSAVAHFQQDSGIGVDGIVGPNTWLKLLGV